ncbi:O-antigen ligase family protein [Thermodesulfobacteriota bacterium]
MSIQYKQSWIDRVIFIGIIALLIFAPLAFGSVHVWAYSIMEIGVFSLLALWFADRFIFSKSDAVEWVKTPMNLALLLLILLIGLQMVPLPSSLVSIISPRTFNDKMQLMELMGKVNRPAFQKSSWMFLSYSVHPTLTEWLKLVAYPGMFFLVLNTIKSKKQIDVLVTVLVLIGLFEAVYAIIQIFSVTPKVWWWKSRVGSSRFASGTFVGSNHFAGYMEMVLCLSIGYVIAQEKRRQRVLSGLGGLRSTFQRVVGWFSPESTHPKLIFLAFVAIIMGVSLLMSASRGGILSLGISMILMSVLFFSKKRYRKFSGFTLGLFLVTLLYGLHLGINPTLNKLESDTGIYERIETTRSIVPMVLDYPVLGVGWGNFRYLYPRYIENHDQVSTSGHAHNDWAEAGIEAGLFGTALILAAFTGLLFRLIRIWMKRRDLYALGIGAGVISGLLSIGIHSFFDFNMHIPANPLALAALLGIGYAALHRQGHGFSESFFFPVRSIEVSRIQRIVMGCMMICVFSAGIVIAGRHFLAEAYCPTEWNSTMNLNWDPELLNIQRAIDYNPGNAEYYFKKANFFISHHKKDAERKAQSEEKEAQNKSADFADYMDSKMEVLSGEAFEREKNERAIESLENAVRLNPARWIYWYELGKRYSLRNYDSLGYLNQWLPMADACFDMGIACAPKDADMLFNVAWYWVWRSGFFPRNNEPVSPKSKSSGEKKSIQSREDAVLKFLGLFQRSLSLNPDNLKKAASRVWEYYPYDDVVLGIVPEGDEALERRVLQVIVKGIR